MSFILFNIEVKTSLFELGMLDMKYNKRIYSKNIYIYIY